MIMRWLVCGCLLVITSTTFAALYAFPDCVNGPLRNNGICDTSKTPKERAQALVSVLTVEELINRTGNINPDIPRLGLSSYNFWSEALHGLATSPGVSFAPSGNFSFATSFPLPINLGATFDDSLIKSVATVISTESRAFNNHGFSGLDYFTPNINPFKDPRWGRGMETPGEDPFHISRYVLNLVDGLQGGIDPPRFKVVADCKHFAAYDLELWQGFDRFSFNALVTTQDLSEYYLPPFQACVRDAKAASVMCSYNEINGTPSCANSFLLSNILRDWWGFDEDRWVTADCDAVDNIWRTHHFTDTPEEAAAIALKAGTDVGCARNGTAFARNLPLAFNQSLITRADLESAVVRLTASLVRLGYFDPPELQPFRQLGWSDVNTPSAQALAYQSAVESIVLLKNDGILPLKKGMFRRLAMIGPWANATSEMQGVKYRGPAPFLIGPIQAARDSGFDVEFAFGTAILGNTTDGFAEALRAAKRSDLIVFAGGIDETSVEGEGRDRITIDWPGNQSELLGELQALGKPIVVLQFGGGQVDDSQLKDNPKINAILWAGYPGQSGGAAIFDILTGKASPSGRLPVTQYPADYVNQIAMTDMSLRPSNTSPGRTYQWYTGVPVFEFGHGLHFTTFALSWHKPPKLRYLTSDIRSAIRGSKTPDLVVLDTVQVVVHNTGQTTSDYVALLFASINAGPEPRPKKRLVSYTRAQSIHPRTSVIVDLPVTVGSLGRADENGDTLIFPGKYTFVVDVGLRRLEDAFHVVGNLVRIDGLPHRTN
ncbi:hypothetical protein ONZ45_g7995 [Pleurotus djamor]|nr:hypothetical protein ONZ45_g7995 [Pleurotus djamor]